jgi:hypothetical protein
MCIASHISCLFFDSIAPRPLVCAVHFVVVVRVCAAMLPSVSSRKGGAAPSSQRGARSASSSNSSTVIRASCVRVRRLVVSSLPPSPITAVACPAMLLFVAAFYALHTTLVALYSRAPGPLSPGPKRCSSHNSSSSSDSPMWRIRPHRPSRRTMTQMMSWMASSSRCLLHCRLRHRPRDHHHRRARTPPPRGGSCCASSG